MLFLDKFEVKINIINISYKYYYNSLLSILKNIFNNIVYFSIRMHVYNFY